MVQRHVRLQPLSQKVYLFVLLYPCMCVRYSYTKPLFIVKIIGVFGFGFRSLKRCAEANAVPKTCILSLDQQEPPKLVPKTLEITV